MQVSFYSEISLFDFKKVWRHPDNGFDSRTGHFAFFACQDICRAGVKFWCLYLIATLWVGLLGFFLHFSNVACVQELFMLLDNSVFLHCCHPQTETPTTLTQSFCVRSVVALDASIQCLVAFTIVLAPCQHTIRFKYTVGLCVERWWIVKNASIWWRSERFNKTLSKNIKYITFFYSPINFLNVPATQLHSPINDHSIWVSRFRSINKCDNNTNKI